MRPRLQRQSAACERCARRPPDRQDHAAGAIRGAVAALRSRTAGLQALIDDGRGDVPLIHLRFRCSYCGHRNIDALVTPKERVLGPAGADDDDR